MIGLNAEEKMQNSTKDDLPALIAAAQNDPTAFGRLYDRYVQPIYRYLYSRIGESHATEDVTSQTFITAYESLPKYRERGQFSAWLFRIAQSKMNDHFRRSRREVGLDAAERMIQREDVLGTLIQDEELTRLRSVIKRLSHEEQELIRLRYVADLPFAEIAGVLGKREDAVKKTLYRLIERLKGQME